MAKFKSFLVLAFMPGALFASPVATDDSAGSYIKLLNEPGITAKIALASLNSYMHAYTWANADISINGGTPLFCGPKTNGLSSQESAALLKDFVSRDPASAKVQVGMVFLFALKAKFPC